MHTDDPKRSGPGHARMPAERVLAQTGSCLLLDSVEQEKRCFPLDA